MTGTLTARLATGRLLRPGSDRIDWLYMILKACITTPAAVRIHKRRAGSTKGFSACLLYKLLKSR